MKAVPPIHLIWAIKVLTFGLLFTASVQVFAEESQLLKAITESIQIAQANWKPLLEDQFEPLNGVQLVMNSKLRETFGLQPQLYLAKYDSKNKTILLGAEFLAWVFATYGEDGIKTVIFHEYGHHIQTLEKAGLNELGADCLSGYSLKMFVGVTNPSRAKEFISLLGDPDHGTGEQRTRAFQLGFNSSKYQNCFEPHHRASIETLPQMGNSTYTRLQVIR